MSDCTSNLYRNERPSSRPPCVPPWHIRVAAYYYGPLSILGTSFETKNVNLVKGLLLVHSIILNL